MRFKEASRKKTGRPTRLSRQTVYRLEAKKAARRVKKVGNFHILEAAITRDAARRRLIDDLLALFGGRIQTRDVAHDRIGQNHATGRRGGGEDSSKS